MKNLAAKTALVTGGSRGIGAAIVKRLANEGANVAFTYNASNKQAEELKKQIEETGAKALAIKADAGNPQEVMAAVKTTATEFGGLHILVNNAGIGLYNDIHNFSLDDFDRVMAVNVRAVFAGIKASLNYLKEGGRIITIGSCQAERMPGAGGSLYAMSKSALVGLTKGVARDLGPKKITVNLVHPGPVDTDMNPANGPQADAQRKLMALDEFGKPDDIASLVAYLAGPESAYITGAGFVIDGGTNI